MRSRILRSCSVSAAQRSSSARRPCAAARSTAAVACRVEQRLARGDAADGVDEVVAPDLLEQVAGRARHDRVEQRLVVGERREHQARRCRARSERISRHTSTPLPSGSRTSSTATSGCSRRDARQRLVGRPRLADDLDVVLGLEQLARRRGGRSRGRRAGTPGSVRQSSCYHRHCHRASRRGAAR